MQLDTEYLRRHYASLSDDALLALDRADLVEAAQRIYDDEVRHRELSQPRRPFRAPRPPDEDDRLADDERELDESPADDSIPDWMDDAAEAYSSYVTHPDEPSSGALDARTVLEAARIPCYLEPYQEPEEDRGGWKYRWRVLVPSKFIHRATSVLDRDIFNEEFESGWRSYMALLTEAELRTMSPEYTFCGLYDRIERIHRAYEEEFKRRGLEP